MPVHHGDLVLPAQLHGLLDQRPDKLFGQPVLAVCVRLVHVTPSCGSDVQFIDSSTMPSILSRSSSLANSQ